MKVVAEVLVVFGLGLALPALATDGLGCEELWNELIGTPPNVDREIVDPELPAPRMVRIEIHAAAPAPSGGCGGIDECEGVVYTKLFVADLPTNRLIFAIATPNSVGTPECRLGVWFSGRPVANEPGVVEFRFRSNYERGGTGCLSSVDERGYRTPLTIFEYDDDFVGAE